MLTFVHSQTLKQMIMSLGLILYYLVCLVIGLGLGKLIAKSTQPKCNHKWKLIESGNIWRGKRNNITGFVRVYECEHCLKMRKEQVEIN